MRWLHAAPSEVEVRGDYCISREAGTVDGDLCAVQMPAAFDSWAPRRRRVRSGRDSTVITSGRSGNRKPNLGAGTRVGR